MNVNQSENVVDGEVARLSRTLTRIDDAVPAAHQDGEQATSAEAAKASLPPVTDIKDEGSVHPPSATADDSIVAANEAVVKNSGANLAQLSRGISHTSSPSVESSIDPHISSLNHHGAPLARQVARINDVSEGADDQSGENRSAGLEAKAESQGLEIKYTKQLPAQGTSVETTTEGRQASSSAGNDDHGERTTQDGGPPLPGKDGSNTERSPLEAREQHVKSKWTQPFSKANKSELLHGVKRRISIILTGSRADSTAEERDEAEADLRSYDTVITLPPEQIPQEEPRTVREEAGAAMTDRDRAGNGDGNGEGGAEKDNAPEAERVNLSRRLSIALLSSLKRQQKDSRKDEAIAYEGAHSVSAVSDLQPPPQASDTPGPAPIQFSPGSLMDKLSKKEAVSAAASPVSPERHGETHSTAPSIAATDANVSTPPRPPPSSPLAQEFKNETRQQPPGSPSKSLWTARMGFFRLRRGHAESSADKQAVHSGADAAMPSQNGAVGAATAEHPSEATSPAPSAPTTPLGRVKSVLGKLSGRGSEHMKDHSERNAEGALQTPSKEKLLSNPTADFSAEQRSSTGKILARHKANVGDSLEAEEQAAKEPSVASSDSIYTASDRPEEDLIAKPSNVPDSKGKQRALDDREDQGRSKQPRLDFPALGGSLRESPISNSGSSTTAAIGPPATA